MASALKKRRSRRRVYGSRYTSRPRDRRFPQISEWVHCLNPRESCSHYGICLRLIGPEKVRVMSYIWGRGIVVRTVRRAEIEPLGGTKKR